MKRYSYVIYCRVINVGELILNHANPKDAIPIDLQPFIRDGSLRIFTAYASVNGIAVKKEDYIAITEDDTLVPVTSALLHARFLLENIEKPLPSLNRSG